MKIYSEIKNLENSIFEIFLKIIFIINKKNFVKKKKIENLLINFWKNNKKKILIKKFFEFEFIEILINFELDNLILKKNILESLINIKNIFNINFEKNFNFFFLKEKKYFLKFFEILKNLINNENIKIRKNVIEIILILKKSISEKNFKEFKNGFDIYYQELINIYIKKYEI